MSQEGDRRGAIIGFIVAMVLLVAFVGFLAHAVLVTAGIALTVVLIGAGLWWLWDRPEKAPSMDRLPPEEQARRREAARILKEVVPPVSEEEARRMLAPPWLRGPDDWPQRPRAPESGS